MARGRREAGGGDPYSRSRIRGGRRFRPPAGRHPPRPPPRPHGPIPRRPGGPGCRPSCRSNHQQPVTSVTPCWIMKRQSTHNTCPLCPMYGWLQRRRTRGRGRGRIRGHIGRLPLAPCGRCGAARPRHGRLIHTVALLTMSFQRIVACLENGALTTCAASWICYSRTGAMTTKTGVVNQFANDMACDGESNGMSY